MKALFVLCVLAVFCGGQSAEAQHPGDRFFRGVLERRDSLLTGGWEKQHHSVQPMAVPGPREKSTADSTHGEKSISIGMTGNLSAGGAMNGNVFSGIAGDHLGALVQYSGSDRWSASLGYSAVGGIRAGYLKELADSLRIIPGAGFARDLGGDMYLAHYTHGHVGYRAGKYFHFELGKGKHFWGDGYRSLILSDNANAYPYFRLTTEVWRIKYTNLWIQLRDISFGQDIRNARLKYAALHSISWNISPAVNLSIYEMVIWQDRDSTSRRHLDFNYLNPLIFFRPLEYAQGSADNEILGLGLRIKANKDLKLYGQLVLDEFKWYEIRRAGGWWANKFGGQLGFTWYNAGTEGLAIQSEMNFVRPFTYTHGSVVQAWGHLNQALAHPWGANFFEWVNHVRYDVGRWSFREEFAWGSFGRDKDTDPDLPGLENYGGNLFRSYSNPVNDYGNKIGQGLKSAFTFHRFEAVWKISGPFDAEWFVSHTWRFERNDYHRRNDHFLMVGIRTAGLLSRAEDF
ncbi:MAG: hypothetical protein JNM00_14595 [Flavobacteriales bacterium]|nr:hypothetical protein [Flavobacteriales bacterium]